jgi:hypothetical protein
MPLRIELNSQDEIFANDAKVDWGRAKTLLARHQQNEAAIVFQTGSSTGAFIRLIDEVPRRDEHWIVLEVEP